MGVPPAAAGEAVNAHIENDALLNTVKVWLYHDEPGGRVFMWPVGYEGDSKCMSWRQEMVSTLEALPDTVRPALEMSRPIWEAFIKALRAVEFEIPASKLLTKVLEREQNRVDALITALIKQGEPQMILQGPIHDPGL